MVTCSSLSFFQGLCNTIRRFPAQKAEDLAIAVDVVTNLPEVDCFVDGMAKFYEVLMTLLLLFIIIFLQCVKPTIF